jgi:hypothetical protein
MILLDDKHGDWNYADDYHVDYVVAGSSAQFPTSATRDDLRHEDFHEQRFFAPAAAEFCRRGKGRQ